MRQDFLPDMVDSVFPDYEMSLTESGMKRFFKK